jgi:hypothetical protein
MLLGNVTLTNIRDYVYRFHITNQRVLRLRDATT